MNQEFGIHNHVKINKLTCAELSDLAKMNGLSNKNPSLFKLKNFNTHMLKTYDSNQDDSGVSYILNVKQIVADFENNLL